MKGRGVGTEKKRTQAFRAVAKKENGRILGPRGLISQQQGKEKEGRGVEHVLGERKGRGWL